MQGAPLQSHPVGALPPPASAALAAEGELKALLGGRVSHAELDRLSYARDMWPLALLWLREGRIPTPPDLIVWPRTEAELQALVALARARKLALIPFGAGSGVCGGTWALRGGISVDLKGFDGIGEVDVAARSVAVGAGVMGETLERHLNARGWTVGHFPSSIATSTVGGWLAARGAGQLSGRYGKIEDMVLSLRVVLGTGAVVETPQRPFLGPDFAQLIIGSEGTLGLITRATLRVHPLAAHRAFRGHEFATVAQGLLAIRTLFHQGLRPAVVRLYDPFDTAFVGSNKGPVEKSSPSERGPMARELLPSLLRTLAPQTLGRPRLFNLATSLLQKSRLILMFEGEEARARDEERAARAICRALSAKDLGEAPGKAWLRKRYDVSFRMSRIFDSGAFADTMEVAAPWEKVLEVYQRVRAAVAPHAFVLCHFSHAYVEGCSLYFSFVGSGGDDAVMRERYAALWGAALAAAVSAGANVSHHHGVGVLKARTYQEQLGEGVHALQALKRSCDPEGILNPGKLAL